MATKRKQREEPVLPGRSVRVVPEGVRPTAADARRLARHTFLEGKRVDMRAMAGELGVNRATLYRWVGSREELLVDGLGVFADHSLQVAIKQATGKGTDRVVRLIVAFLEQVVDNLGMKVFLRDESELALRLLTRSDYGLQRKLVDVVLAALEEEVASGALSLDVDLDEAAVAIIQMVSTFAYLDLITAGTPDAHRAEPILRMLLR